MGYSAINQCFGTVQEAAQATCGQYPHQSESGGVAYTWSCVGASADGSSLSLVRSGSDGSSVSQALPVSFGQCDPLETYTDLGTLWGLGLAAACGVYLVKQFVYRLVANQ